MHPPRRQPVPVVPSAVAACCLPNRNIKNANLLARFGCLLNGESRARNQETNHRVSINSPHPKKKTPAIASLSGPGQGHADHKEP